MCGYSCTLVTNFGKYEVVNSGKRRREHEGFERVVVFVP